MGFLDTLLGRTDETGALVLDELHRMTSLIEDELVAKPVELVAAKDLVNTSDWTKDLIDD